jgi:hypothetical protein
VVVKVKEEWNNDDGGGEGWLSSRADDGDGVDPVAAAVMSKRVASKRAWEILAPGRCPSQNPPVRV